MKTHCKMSFGTNCNKLKNKLIKKKMSVGGKD